MGSTGSVDRKAQGMAELMANERGGTEDGRPPPLDAHAEGSSGGKGSSGESPKLGIRRKNPRSPPAGAGVRKRGGGGTQPRAPKRDINLFSGNGPVTAWKKGHLVGKGATGAVFEAMELSSQGIFCVKEIEFADDFADNPHDMQRFEALRREIELLKDIFHENVVRFLGVDRVNYSIYIQMEYIYGGNIQDIVRNFGPLSEETAGKFTLQILNGLDYLHDKNIIHRDVKGANILVGVDGTVKLADFGAAKRVLDHEELFKTLAGTPYWMAPEVVRQEGHNKAADVWSLGATVLQMMTGSAPYQSLPPVPALFKIGHSNESPVPDDMRGASAHAVDFIKTCLSRDASKRPTVKQLMHHPWVVKQRALRQSKLDRARRALEQDSTASVVSVGASSSRSGGNLALRTSQAAEQGLVDEETQIQEFVAYVSERHRALQVEQQTRCAEEIEDSPHEVTYLCRAELDDGSGSEETRRDEDTLGGDAADCRSSGRSPQRVATGTRATGVGVPHHSASRSESESGSSSSRLPPIGATAARSSSSNALSATAPHNTSPQPHNNAAILPPNAVETFTDEEEDDVMFEDDFDEAHFDQIIAGLGQAHPTAAVGGPRLPA